MVALLVNLIIFIISIIAMSKFSHITIKSSIALSKITRLGELAIGFVLLSLITSVPELILSIMAIFYGEVGISIGNILGSNVANIALILGIVSIIYPLKVTERSLRKILNILSVSVLILLLLLILRTVKTVIGILLVITFLVFSLYVTKRRVTIEKLRTRAKTPIEEIIISFRFYKHLFLICFGIVGMIIASHFTIKSAASIAIKLNIHEIVIGAIMVAFGTSLPEFFTTLKAVKEKHVNLALGNIVGSCLTNLTLVLGMTLIFAPLQVDMETFYTLIIFTLTGTFLLEFFLGNLGRNKLDRLEGIILLFLYIAFIATIYGMEIGLLRFLQF